ILQKAEFDALRVDEPQAEGLRRITSAEPGENGFEGDGLAAAGGSCDEQVWRAGRREVDGDWVAVHVGADGDDETPVGPVVAVPEVLCYDGVALRSGLGDFEDHGAQVQVGADVVLCLEG